MQGSDEADNFLAFDPFTGEALLTREQMDAIAREIEAKKIARANRPPEGWQSATMLEKTHVGGSRALNQQMETLREAKLAEGLTPEQVQRAWVGRYAPLFGREALYASPQAIAVLPIRKRSQAAPTPPEGWKNVSMARKLYAGEHAVLHRKFKALRALKLAEGMSAEEVQREWIGIYTSPSGREILYASPQALAAMKLKAREHAAPPMPEDWKSASMLDESHVGYSAFQEGLEALRASKLAEGLSPEIVDRKWVGLYSTRGREVLCGSPQAISMLELTRPRTERAPPAPPGWRSAVALMASYIGGADDINRHMQKLRAAKLAEGLSPHDVDTQWVGVYLSERGRELLHASPQAVDAMCLTPRTQAFEPIPQEWLSFATIKKTYVCDSSTLKQRLEGLCAQKRAMGLPAEVVRREWGGYYRSPGGREELYMSPQALAELGLKRRADKAPPALTGWQTAVQLKVSYHGQNVRINQDLAALRDAKLAEGLSAKEVQDAWVGLYTSPGRNEALHGSPCAIALLEQQGVLRAREQPAPAEPPSGFAQRVGHTARAIDPDSIAAEKARSRGWAMGKSE